MDLDREFGLIVAEFGSVLTALDARQTQLRPTGAPERWCVQEHVEHLLMTYAATVGAAEARLAKGTPTKAKPIMAQRIGRFMLLRLQRFPRGRQAPAAVAPQMTAALDGDALLARVKAAVGELDRKMAEAELIFGRRMRAISHFVLGPLSVAEWRRFHLVHARHHIAIVKSILAESRN